MLFRSELQATELLFRGVLEPIGPEALAVVFVALIHEERRRGGGVHLPHAVHGALRRRVAETLAELAGLEAGLGVAAPLKQPDFGLTPEVIGWFRWQSIEEVSESGEHSAGDVCRALRMAIQLMREVRHAIDPKWDLHDRLADAIARVNRDEVDARRQLELG